MSNNQDPQSDGPVPSSPLFFSGASSDAGRDNIASTPDDRRASEVSSPLRYSSSPPPPSSRRGVPSSSGIRPSRRGASSGLFSDLSDSQGASQRSRHRRGDIFSSDIMSTPQRRRFVDETLSSSNGNNGNTQFSAQSEENQNNPDEPIRVIWGTNVSIQESMSMFREFLQNYKSKYRRAYDGEEVPAGEGEDLVYTNMLNQMRLLGLSNLNLDVKNLLAYPRTQKLYYQLINYPQEVIPIMDQTIKDTMVALAADDNAQLDEIETKLYKVRPYGLASQKGMRDLNPGDIDKLVTIKGLVIRASPVIPDMKESFFKCSVCNHTIVVEIDRGTIAEPTQCPRDVCKQMNSMQLVHNRSLFADKQIVRLQETPDITPDGQTPHSVSLCVYDELVDVCKAGDRIEVTAIFRSVPVRINPRQRTLKSLFKTYLDVVHIQKVDKKRMGIDVSTIAGEEENLEVQGSELQQNQQDVEEVRHVSESDIAKIKQVAEREDVYELLSRSLAPSIYEQDDVKKGILLQLFGGTNKTFEKGGSPRYRGDINVLLVGDPSTSKSQILQYVHKIAPRGIYTSGKGSSAVGLTAYVTRDIETKQLVLESGALVLSDGGVCCIDEFDKMSDATRSVLHEVMEQQTVSIAKAGIITTLNARTSILASANPIGSKYDVNMSVPQNIDLPPTLLSRFDLVYLMIDKIDAQTDRHLANHLTSMYLEDAPESGSRHEILPVEFLTMYISYAKQHVQPKITEEAKEELVKAYVAMRKLGEDVRASEKRITATTRQLESMIRLSEAHAKMRLAEEVTRDDVTEAVRLIQSAIKEYAMDPQTGRIDMDLVQTGTSSAQRQLRSGLKKHLLGLLDATVSGGASEMRYDDLAKRVNETSPERFENLEIGEAVRSLEQEGQISVTGTGGRRVVRRITGV
ncbi:DNA replication licensing factor Mcm4p [Trichomonascus vanleenenianus]|uniref:MCM DNA helicase complex subunit MCM4 n=1 Tax=Trichomonascus vanleenenianus TaxID=2268995 RepID=UPI003EC96D1C